MSIERTIYKYYRQKLMDEMTKDEGLRLAVEDEKIRILKKIDNQTSNKQSIIQNVAGNFISDGIIFILRRLIK